MGDRQLAPGVGATAPEPGVSRKKNPSPEAQPRADRQPRGGFVAYGGYAHPGGCFECRCSPFLRPPRDAAILSPPFSTGFPHVCSPHSGGYAATQLHQPAISLSPVPRALNSARYARRLSVACTPACGPRLAASTFFMLDASVRYLPPLSRI